MCKILLEIRRVKSILMRSQTEMRSGHGKAFSQIVCLQKDFVEGEFKSNKMGFLAEEICKQNSKGLCGITI